MQKNLHIFVALFFLLFIYCFSVDRVYALSLEVHIPEKYTEVNVGDRIYFEVNVKYPENPSRKDLILEYQILEGTNVITEAKVLKAVENQASFIDFIVIPESAKTGIHSIKIGVSDYQGLDESVSASFHIIGKKEDQIKYYFLFLLSAISFVGVLAIINIILVKRSLDK